MNFKIQRIGILLQILFKSIDKKFVELNERKRRIRRLTACELNVILILRIDFKRLTIFRSIQN